MVTYEKNERYINIIKGISVILIFFIFSLFKNLPLELLHINYENLTNTLKEIYSISIEIIMISLIILLFKNQYKNALKDLKQNHLKYFKENFKYYLMGVIAMMSANYLITFLGGEMSNNETEIRNMFDSFPIYTYIASVFLAPILEESVFRLGFRNIFKNKLLFILTSGLIFASLHLLGSLNNPLIFLHLIAYSGCGIAFAYIMAKTNNIFVSMGFHFMHNGILMSLQLLVLILS